MVNYSTCGCKIMQQEKRELSIIMEMFGERVSGEWLGKKPEGNRLRSDMRGKNT